MCRLEVTLYEQERSESTGEARCSDFGQEFQNEKKKETLSLLGWGNRLARTWAYSRRRRKVAHEKVPQMAVMPRINSYHARYRVKRCRSRRRRPYADQLRLADLM